MWQELEARRRAEMAAAAAAASENFEVNVCFATDYG